MANEKERKRFHVDLRHIVLEKLSSSLIIFKSCMKRRPRKNISRWIEYRATAISALEDDWSRFSETEGKDPKKMKKRSRQQKQKIFSEESDQEILQIEQITSSEESSEMEQRPKKRKRKLKTKRGRPSPKKRTETRKSREVGFHLPGFDEMIEIE